MEAQAFHDHLCSTQGNANLFRNKLKKIKCIQTFFQQVSGEANLKLAVTALEADSWRFNCQGLVMLRKCLEANMKLEKEDLESICTNILRILQSKILSTGGTQLIYLFDMIECLAFLYLEQIEDWLKTLPEPLLKCLNKGLNKWVQVRFFQLFTLIAETYAPAVSFGLFLETLTSLPAGSQGSIAALKVLLKITEDLPDCRVRDLEHLKILHKFAKYPSDSYVYFYSRLILANLGCETALK